MRPCTTEELAGLPPVPDERWEVVWLMPGETVPFGAHIAGGPEWMPATWMPCPISMSPAGMSVLIPRRSGWMRVDSEEARRWYEGAEKDKDGIARCWCFGRGRGGAGECLMDGDVLEAWSTHVWGITHIQPLPAAPEDSNA